MVRIEGLGSEQYYRAVIHYGHAYAPITEEDLHAAWECLRLPTEEFLAALPDTIAPNGYLQNRIREAIAKAGDHPRLATALKDSIIKLIGKRPASPSP